jgi:hypothetical protein
MREASMATVVESRPAIHRRPGFFTRLLDRCIQLLPYMALPGYYPFSHVYHFRRGEQAHKQKIRLPPTTLHR